MHLKRGILRTSRSISLSKCDDRPCLRVSLNTTTLVSGKALAAGF